MWGSSVHHSQNSQLLHFFADNSDMMDSDHATCCYPMAIIRQDLYFELGIYILTCGSMDRGGHPCNIKRMAMGCQGLYIGGLSFITIMPPPSKRFCFSVKNFFLIATLSKEVAME